MRHKIDITKPENYEFRGAKHNASIYEFEIDENVYIVKYIYDYNGKYGSHSVDIYGKSFIDDDVILKEESDVKEIKRKIIQISAADDCIFALTDNGEIFCHHSNGSSWQQLKDLPTK